MILHSKLEYYDANTCEIYYSYDNCPMIDIVSVGVCECGVRSGRRRSYLLPPLFNSFILAWLGLLIST